MTAKTNNQPFGVECAQYSYPQEPTRLDPGVNSVMLALGTSNRNIEGVLRYYVESHNLAKSAMPMIGENFRIVAGLAPIEFLKQLDSFCFKFPNDSGLENGLVFHGLINEVRSSKEKKPHVLIVNPPVEFVECLRGYQWPYNYNVTVCVTNELVAKIYRMDPPLRAMAFTSLDKLSTATTYTHALVFGTKIHRAEVQPMLAKAF